MPSALIIGMRRSRHAGNASRHQAMKYSTFAANRDPCIQNICIPNRDLVRLSLGRKQNGYNSGFNVLSDRQFVSAKKRRLSRPTPKLWRSNPQERVVSCQLPWWQEEIRHIAVRSPGELHHRRGYQAKTGDNTSRKLHAVDMRPDKAVG